MIDTTKSNTKVIPANTSRESIAGVVLVVEIVDNKGKGHISTRITTLKGSVEEKLRQYREATGGEWSGFGEKVITRYEKLENKPGAINTSPPIALPPHTRKAQAEIDELVARARRFLQEDKDTQREKKEIQSII